MSLFVLTAAAELEVKSLRKRLKIKILGDECPDPVITWEEFYEKYPLLQRSYSDVCRFQVSKYIRKNIAESRYIAPTAIQMQAMPVLLSVCSISWLLAIHTFRAENC